MKLEPQKARMTMFVYNDPENNVVVNLGVKIGGKLYEIDGVLAPFAFGPIDPCEFCNITASFGEYDLETVY